ncbi:MAG: hypothetical protein N2450_07440 [bacterium]|nr:hypothetical protein [bacterium]
MNTQTMLVLGALALIGTITLMVNNTLLETTSKVTEANVTLTALSLAEGMISEVMLRRYDENPNATSTSQFVANASLGPDAGESYPDYDDVDDYRNLTRSTIINGVNFSITVNVNYVSDTDLSTIQTSQTYNKLVTVRVQSIYLRSLANNTLTLSYIASYVRLFQ